MKALTMAFKLLEIAQQRGRRLNAHPICYLSSGLAGASLMGFKQNVNKCRMPDHVGLSTTFDNISSSSPLWESFSDAVAENAGVLRMEGWAHAALAQSLAASFSKKVSAAQPTVSVKPAAVAALMALPKPGSQPTRTWDSARPP